MRKSELIKIYKQVLDDELKKIPDSVITAVNNLEETECKTDVVIATAVSISVERSLLACLNLLLRSGLIVESD